MNAALLSGHFELSSSLHSDTYVQCSAYLQRPKNMQKVGEDLSREWYGEVDMVISPAVGGIVIGYEVAKALGVPFAFTERVDGVMELRRGFEIMPESKILIVEDVVTTGRSAAEVATVILDHGAHDVGLMCIVKRYANVPGFDNVFSLHKVSATQWPADQCPLCAKNVPLDKPGSRTLA